MRTVKLGEIFDIARGGSPRPIKDFLTDSPDGINWIMIGDATGGDKYIRSTGKKIIPEGVARSRRVKPGDFLLTNSMSFGHPYILKTSGCIHDGWLVLSKRSEDIYEDFFYHLLGSPSVYQQFSARAAGAVVKNLNIDIVANVSVAFPPLEEQKRIAAILDKADALRRKRAQALQLTDQFLQSLFLDMFGDPVTNPKGWETKKFGDPTVGTLDRGRSRHRPRNAPELLGGPYPLIQTGEVASCRRYITTHSQTYSELGLKQSKMWPAGTLCITIAANIAKTGILRFDACFPDSVVGYAPAKGMRTEYVQSWLSFLQRILEENAPESAQKNINLRILGELDIPVPDADLQNKFAEIVKKVEQTSLKHTASAADIEALSSSLAVDAFRGEL